MTVQKLMMFASTVVYSVQQMLPHFTEMERAILANPSLPSPPLLQFLEAQENPYHTKLLLIQPTV